MKNAILLGGDGSSVARGGTEAPIFERRQRLLVELGTDTLQNGFTNDLTELVNRDFDHHVAFVVQQFPRIENRIGHRDGKRGTNFVSESRPVNQRAIGKSRGRAVALIRDGRRFRLILRARGREREWWGRQLC